METLPIVIFRISGRYAHFRRPYTNVSSLSYPFPPRPTIAGLLGAILGIQKDKVADTFNERNLTVAVAIEKQVKTVTHVTNFRQDGIGGIDYSIKKPKKGWKSKELKNIPPYNEATQIPMELLRNPSFLIYVHLDDTSMFFELGSRLKTDRFVYTPCLGLSEFLASVEYVDDGNAIKLETGEYEVKSVIAKDDCILLKDKLQAEKHQVQELKSPHLGTVTREFTYKKYLVNMMPNPLPVEMKVNAYRLDNTVISFL
ncbi:MAG: type I-B CRISPR-associated protein Cas5 [Candidatus Schekmanbacteria bacterium RBG_16_38_10]|uniref:Type I-B CRISPR-associated protein Cas5 n=1 Tax=Candidatus Schekmanbacteria bacterium RBG_16_38_10 TaxID=1817879 RepID=A0A1F7S227_9BACT|nr:MAG: type I-B CRISPR-associated protein Cas5 [Candidatus Schekmanbacteria bacterium RBG_16_38_10]